MKKTIRIAALLLTMSLAFSGCKKTQGPKGETGTQGPAGPAGTANISYEVVIVASSDWGLEGNNTFWSKTVYNAKVTSDVYSRGMVTCYLDNGSEYLAMPVTLLDIEYYYGYSEGRVTLKVRSASGTKSVPRPDFTIFKIAIIPPAN